MEVLAAAENIVSPKGIANGKRVGGGAVLENIAPTPPLSPSWGAFVLSPSNSQQSSPGTLLSSPGQQSVATASATTPVSSKSGGGKRRAKTEATATSEDDSSALDVDSEELASLQPTVRAKLHTLQVDLTNAQEDVAQYKAEYERIAEEGRLLYTTYASKVNQLKQLAAHNAKLQGDAESSKQRETELKEQIAALQKEEEMWKAKFRDQTERFKEAFSALDRMKAQQAEDQATIRRLQSSSGNTSGFSNSSSSSSLMSLENERRYKDKIATLEKQLSDLKQRVEQRSNVAVSANATPAELRERLEALVLSNALLRDDNKALLLEIAKGGGGHITTAAKQHETELLNTQKELNSARKDLQATQKELMLAQTQLQQSQAQIQMLQKDLAIAQQQLQDAEAASQDAKSEAEALQARTEALTEQIAAHAPIKAELEAARVQISEFRAADYSRRLAAAVAERDAWKRRAEQLSVTLEQAIEVDMQQKAVSERLRETVVYVKSEAQRIRRVKSDAEETKKTAESRLSEIASREEQEKICSERIELVEHRCTSLARALQDAERQTEEAREQLKSCEQKLKSVEAELSEQQALSHSLEECAKDAETLAQQLCQQLNAAQQQSAADKAVVLEQTATMQKMQSQVESLEQERQELKVLSGKLLEATQTCSAELEEREGDICRLEQEIQGLQRALQERDQACRDISITLDRKLEEFHRTLDAKQEECATLRKLVDDARASDSTDKKRLRAELEASLEQEREALITTKVECESLQLRLSTALAQRDQMRVVQEALLDAMDVKLSDASMTELRALLNEVRELSKSCAAANDDLMQQLQSVDKKDQLRAAATIEQLQKQLVDTKAKSNKSIKLLYSQLTASRERLAVLGAAVEEVREMLANGQNVSACLEITESALAQLAATGEPL